MKKRGLTPLVEKTRSTSRLTWRNSLMGFTLVETLVAISLLSIAVVAPMSLASQSLAAAYYSRDQIAAYHFAQEAVEAVRSIRDGQILQVAQDTTGTPINTFGFIPTNNEPFTVDARKADPSEAIAPCPVDGCPPLQTDGTLYGYELGWAPTYFTRTVRASFVGGLQEELRVTVTITWKTGAFKIRTFNISANLYRWLPDGLNQT